MATQPPPPPGPPLAPPPAAGGGKLTPGRGWYVAALLVLLAIGGPSLGAFLSGLNGLTDEFIRVRVPGEVPVDLEAGTYTIFYEYRGEFEGESFSTSSTLPEMQAQVTSSDGSSVAATPSTGSFEYNWFGRAGYSVGEVDVPAEGRYVFSAEYVDATESEPVVLALGKDRARFTVLIVVGIIGMIAASFVAFVIWLIVIILRSRNKRRMRAAGMLA